MRQSQTVFLDLWRFRIDTPVLFSRFNRRQVALGSLGLSVPDRVPCRGSLLALLRGYRIEGCPPLLNVLAFAVRTDNPALLILRDCQDFRELFVAGPTKKIILGHDYLPAEKRYGRKS